MQNKFQVSVCSDLDYEEMVADVYYEEIPVAMITQENGIEEMEIEIFAPYEERKSWQFSLDRFVEAIASGKAALIRMQKLPE